MNQKYYQIEEPRELQILAALNDGSATEDQIQEVVNDINKHLATTAGTLLNYNGKFKKAGLKALQDNYRLFTNEEEDVSAKTNALISNLMEVVMSAKKPNIPPKLVGIIIEHLNGTATDKNITNKVKYVSIPFVLGTPDENTLPKSGQA